YDIQSKVDALLLAVVDKESDIPQIRDHLAIELAKLATQGNVIIESAEFLKQHGLDSIPLTNWAAHRERAEKTLSKTLSRRGYNSKHNVRQLEFPAKSSSGILVVTGESGCGKSWAINSLALQAASSSQLPILVESRGDGERDLKKVAETFWHDIHDGDELLAFSRIEKRLGKVLGEATSAGVAVFIDGVASLQEANSLLQYDWEGENSSLAFSCSPEIAELLEQKHPHRVNVLTVDHFSLPQLHEYLHRRIGDAWPTIPSDIRSTLLTPLIAASYCDLFGKEDFKLESEYQLFQSVFGSRVSGKSTSTPLDETAIDQLAIGVREGGNYPWTKQQLVDAGLKNDHVVRLVSNGWLVQSDSDSFRVFHDRLLNWSIASATERQLASGTITDEEFLAYLSEVYNGDPQNKINFGYVPMDALWLLVNRQPNKSELALNVIKAFEELSNRRYEDLYEMIVTLGDCISDVLFMRYKEFDSFHWPAKLIEKTVIRTSERKLESYVRELIEDKNPLMRRKAVLLAKDSAFPSLASQFWKVHVAGQDNPELYGEKEERKVFLYQETFRALNQAVKANPSWLDQQLSSPSDKAPKQLNDLAKMVGNAEDNGALWKKHKEILVEKLSDSHNWSLIRCIDRFRDSSAIQLLENWVVCSDRTACSLAIRALARLDCNRAISRLKETDPKMMRMTKAWCFREIVERNRDQANEEILAWMHAIDDPWEIGLLFEGRENDLTVEQLDFLLESLANRLSARTDEKVGSSFHFEFGMLGRISRIELIECIRQKAGADLEDQIKKFLLDLGPHQGGWGMVSGRSGALMTLHLMGAESLTQVINKFLEDDDQYGLNETIEWAVKAPNVETFEKLLDISHSEESWPGTSTAPAGKKIAIVQNDALRCLASHGMWQEVSKGVKHLGRDLYRGLEHPTEPVEEEWVSDLQNEVEQLPSVGNVTALGIFGTPNQGEVILNVLRSSEPESDLALNCLVALRYCSLFSDDAVEEVAKHLRIEQHRYAATCYLSEASNEAAWKVLIEDLETNFDHVNALNLINLSDHSERAIEICHEQLTKKRVFAEYQMLEILLTQIANEVQRNQLLRNESVQAFMHFEASKSEGRSWHTGSKERMIRCLALSDTKLAYSACLKCIDYKGAKDRTHYPALLREIDAEKSVFDLTERLVNESSRLMVNSILRTLHGLDLSKQIEQFKGDECKLKRRAACELLSVGMKSDRTILQLSEMLADHSDEVVQAAIKGLQTARDFENQTEQMTAIAGEPNRKKRTALIDAFVNTCEPGEEHNLLTQNIQTTMKHLSWFEWENAKKRLKKRGKKRDNALERADKRDD
ncbi:MAG: ATP-binding protein, partial [Planctomycetota bacterium]